MSTERASRPGWFTLLRDTIIFLTGIAVILQQAGLLAPLGYPAPAGGPSVILIVGGGLDG